MAMLYPSIVEDSIGRGTSSISQALLWAFDVFWRLAGNIEKWLMLDSKGLRDQDQQHALVCTGPAHQLSPSSSQASAPRPCCSLFCASPQAHPRVSLLSSAVSPRAQAGL